LFYFDKRKKLRAKSIKEFLFYLPRQQGRQSKILKALLHPVQSQVSQEQQNALQSTLLHVSQQQS
jgi:hypothetical protein